MALTKISTGGVKDDAASQAKIADEAIDEARLQISNAGSNGQFLQKQSGNTGGLTWAAANEYTHPNHSGEVTSSADGAQTIASNVVDEDNLKISNAGTNGQYLQKQSGNTGGLTWADVTVPPSGNTVDLVADGAIAAGKPCIIKSNGKAEQVKEVQNDITPINSVGSQTTIFNDDTVGRIAADYNPDSTSAGHGIILAVWNDDNRIKGRFCRYASASSLATIGSTFNISDASGANSENSATPLVEYAGAGYWFVIWQTAGGASNHCETRMVSYDSSANEVVSGAVSLGYNAKDFAAARISDTRMAVMGRGVGGSGNDKNTLKIIDFSGSGTSRTWSGGSTIDLGAQPFGYPGGLVYDSTNSRLVAVTGSGSSNFTISARSGTVSGSAGSGTVTWGTAIDISDASVSSVNSNVGFNSTTGKIIALWMDGGTNDDGDIQGCVLTTSSSDNSISKGTTATTTIEMGNSGQNGQSKRIATSATGKFAFGYARGTANGAGKMLGISVSGTTLTFDSSEATIGNNKTEYPVTLYCSTSKVWIQIQNAESAGYWGPHVLGTPSTAHQTGSNLTTSNKNFLGFAEDAISDDATGTIKLPGNVVSNQSGLTAGTMYKVNNDGTLTANWNNSAVGGTAIASDKLIISRAGPQS